nr:MAG TPA: hypothetical protein [Caudoviricetes sp.]
MKIITYNNKINRRGFTPSIFCIIYYNYEKNKDK